ncbi:hypothetical protein AB0M28_09535, partial [Streptomyces sp. NPDC051940]
MCARRAPFGPLRRRRKRNARAEAPRRPRRRCFHHQELAARPQAAHDDYQPRGDRSQATPEEV